MEACEGLRNARLVASQLTELSMAWCKGADQFCLRAPSLQVLTPWNTPKCSSVQNAQAICCCVAASARSGLQAP